jgi:hypothetical protein
MLQQGVDLKQLRIDFGSTFILDKATCYTAHLIKEAEVLICESVLVPAY